ncbi:MAG: 4'-phosphopantetheinyl transferase family protein [Saprospiraceae bacterium]
MPLLLTAHPFPDATFGLWQIGESEGFFRADLPLSAVEEAELAQHHNPLRRLEWLAGRWLLHKLSGSTQRLALAKDAFSKPFFPENLQLACSLSHSKGNVGALIVASSAAIKGAGCDIQVLTEKMPRIAHKFLNEMERDFVASRPEAERFDLLHLFWTAKESLYKAYGLKQLDFRKNIFVQEIRWDGQNGQAVGKIEKGGFRQPFDLVFGKIALSDADALVWAVCHGE